MRNMTVRTMTRKLDRSSGTAGVRGHNPVGEWFRHWSWNWWVTLTFDHVISGDGASAVFDEYLNELERHLRAPVSCLIGREDENDSGCGMPAVRVHFHLLMAAGVYFPKAAITGLWKLPRFGGYRTAGESPYVRPYDPNKGAANYTLKFQKDPAWDVGYRHLDLLSPRAPKSAATSSRQRRRLSRRDARLPEQSLAKPGCDAGSEPGATFQVFIPARHSSTGCNTRNAAICQVASTPGGVDCCLTPERR